MGKVDIGIACSSAQFSQWWAKIMGFLLQEQSNGVDIGRIHAISSALPDHNKNYVVDNQQGIAPADVKRRNDLTDANRAALVGGFLHGDSEWLFQIDDDTVPPAGALSHLLSLRREFVGGVYFLGGPPYNVVAYYRLSDGTYAGVLDYPVGQLVAVDSIGMGCTLIHRSVFEKIQAAHVVLSRPNGSLTPVLRSKFEEGSAAFEFSEETPEERFVNGCLITPLRERHPDDKRPWPFFSMEYGRTEDHHFCELAANVGIRPYLETAVVCDHWKLKAINKADHDRYLTERAG
jgi:hypothetical protein